METSCSWRSSLDILFASVPVRSCVEAAKLMQALFDLEATNSELKQDLRDLYITSAAEIDVGSTRKAIVIHVRAPVVASIPLTLQLIRIIDTNSDS